MRRVVPLLLLLASCGPKAIVSNAGSYPAVFGTYLRKANTPTVNCSTGPASLIIAPSGGETLDVVQQDSVLTVGVLTGTVDMMGNITLTSGSTNAVSGTYADGTAVSGPITETGTFDTSTATKQFDLILSWMSSDGNCTGVMTEDTWTAQ